MHHNLAIIFNNIFVMRWKAFLDEISHFKYFLARYMLRNNVKVGGEKNKRKPRGNSSLETTRCSCYIEEQYGQRWLLCARD